MKIVRHVVIFCIILCFPLIGSATTYYVDSVSGLDSNNGYSVSTPWKSIVKVNATIFAPGDSVLFKAGGRWRENLVPSSSGTADKPITFGMYGTGDKPIIQGKAAYQYSASQWVSAGTNIWKSTFNGSNGYPSMASIGGKALNKAVTWAEFGQSRPFYLEGVSGGMYNVYIYSTVNPSQLGEVWVWGGGTQLSNIKISSKSYIVIQNLNLRHAGWYNIFIEGSGSNGILIDNCILHGSPQNFGVHNSAKNVTLQNSVVSEADWGIYIGASDNVKIIGNDISGGRFACPDLVGGEGGCLAPSVYLNEGDTTNLLVEYNKIHDCESYAIAEYGYDANNRIENAIYRYNDISDAWFGFWSMSMANGVFNTKFYYNIIHSPKLKTPVALPSMGTQKSSGIRMYRANNSVMAYNNAIIDYPVGIEVAAANAFTAKNNIISNAQFNVLNGTSSTANVFDYNLYYPNVGAGSFASGETSYDFAGWRAQGQDVHSISADPRLNSDLTLMTGSPAINSGTNVGLASDYYGKNIVMSPDIGACEFDGVSTTTNPPTPPPTEPPPSEPPTPAEPPVSYYYSIGGSVSGLLGNSLTLKNNGTDSIILRYDGNFVFPKPLSKGSSYSVTVNKQLPGQICRVYNGSGAVSNSNITNVRVACTRKNNR